jgi:ribose transport system substrate-binding protein
VEEITRRRFLVRAGSGFLGLTVAGCSGAAGSKTHGKLRIPLANSFIGNSWRLEMENLYKAALQMEPYRSQVYGSVYNASNDLAKQTQQVSDLISARVDAILIDAASPTGLAGVVEQAIQRGILVIGFDNIVAAKGALTVNTDQFQFGKQLAEWLVKKLHGKGSIIMVTGVPGTFVDTQRNAGGMSVFSKHPGVKIVNKIPGQWDSGVAQRNTAAVLPSLPKIDGIWCQGGTDGVLKAFQEAGRPLPPTAGESENGFRKFMIGAEGNKTKLDAFSIGQPPYLVLIALEAARRILRHEYPRKNITVPFPTVDTQTVKPGKTVFPQIYDSFFTPFTDTSKAHTVHTTLKMVQTGEPSGLHLAVNLPKP